MLNTRVLEHTNKWAGSEYTDEAMLHASMDISAVFSLVMKPVTHRRLRGHWQIEWDKQKYNELHIVKPQSGKFNTQTL